MIRSFADPETESIFRRVGSRGVPADLHRNDFRELVILDGADTVNDLHTPPGNRLEKLPGDRAGQYSVRINDRWRVCFVWRGSDAYEVRTVVN